MQFFGVAGSVSAVVDLDAGAEAAKRDPELVYEYSLLGK